MFTGSVLVQPVATWVLSECACIEKVLKQELAIEEKGLLKQELATELPSRLLCSGPDTEEEEGKGCLCAE